MPKYGKKSQASYGQQRLSSKIVTLPKVSATKAQAAQVPATAAQAVPSAPPGTKSFAGFKAKFEFTEKGIAVHTDVRYAKSVRKDLIPKIVARWSKTHEEVFYKPNQPYHYVWMTASGTVVPETEVSYFQVDEKTGKESSVAPFLRTDTIKVEKLLPRAELEDFLPSDHYEIWSDNPGPLAQTADWLEKEDKIAVCKFSFGRGFKEYYGIIYPSRNGDEFAMMMMLTQGRIKHAHEMPFKVQGNQYTQAEAQVQGTLEQL